MKFPYISTTVGTQDPIRSGSTLRWLFHHHSFEDFWRGHVVQYPTTLKHNADQHVHELHKLKSCTRMTSCESNTSISTWAASLCIRTTKQYAFMSNLMHLSAITYGFSSCQRCTYPVRGVWALVSNLVCLSGAACRSRRWFFWTPSPLRSCNRPSWTPESSPQRLEIPAPMWHTSTARFP